MVEWFIRKKWRKRGCFGRSGLLLFLVHLRDLMFYVNIETRSKGREKEVGVHSRRSLDFSTTPKASGVLIDF